MFSRKLSGLLGLIPFILLTLVVIVVMAWLGLPFIAIGLMGGVLLLITVLSLIAHLRGTRQRTQNFSTFESNALGDPNTEEFVAPYHSDLPWQTAERVVRAAGPIIRTYSGLSQIIKGGSWGFLGKSVIKDAENALILTSHRLFFLMLGPGDIKRFSPSSSQAAGFLDAIPGDAQAKRYWLYRSGAGEVSAALTAVVSTRDLNQIREEFFTFSIPLADVQAFGLVASRRSLRINTGQGTFIYTFRRPQDLEMMGRELSGLGLKVTNS